MQKSSARSVPKAIIYALLICTLLYVLITLVLTGIVNYQNLAVRDPLAYVIKLVEKYSDF